MSLAASQIPGKYLCFLVTRATEKQLVDPEDLVLSLKRLRDFLVEREMKEILLPVYDPNRGRLRPREFYALIHKSFVIKHRSVLTKEILFEYSLSIG